MKYMVEWTVPQSTYWATIGRFLDTGGPAPEGVEMLGRWHSMTNGHGVAICETNDEKALYRWQAQWADLIPMSVSPCLDDAAAGDVFEKLNKER